MDRTLRPGSQPLLGVAYATFALAGASNAVVSPSTRTAPFVLLTVVGSIALARYASEFTRPALRRATRRWLGLALATALPYALVVASSTDVAPIDRSLPAAALETVAAATVLTAMTFAAMFAVATVGLHPGRPSPEERVLDD